MDIKNNQFYGNESETYFVNQFGAIFCVQSPDLVNVGDYRRVTSLPTDVRPVSDATINEAGIELADEILEVR